VQPQPVVGAWSTALCDCCAQPGGCRRSLYTCACHACAFGDLAVASPAQAFPFAGPDGWAKACVAFPCFPLLGCMARSGLRREYTLAGDPMLDLWVSMYCSCCATCQAYREVLIRRAAAEAALWHRGEVGLPQGSFPVQGVPAAFVASAQAGAYTPPVLQEALKNY